MRGDILAETKQVGIILLPVKEQNGRAVFPVQKIVQKPRGGRKFGGVQATKRLRAWLMF